MTDYACISALGYLYTLVQGKDQAEAGDLRGKNRLRLFMFIATEKGKCCA